MKIGDIQIMMKKLWQPLLSGFALLALSTMGPSQSAHAADEKRQITTETEVVILTNSGFVPSRITRSRGDFRLQVASALPLSNLTLEMQDAAQKSLKAKAFANSKGQRQRWLDDYALTPGSYVLQVKEAPKFKLEIVIGK